LNLVFAVAFVAILLELPDFSSALYPRLVTLYLILGAGGASTLTFFRDYDGWR
jgi:hypothetical protein